MHIAVKCRRSYAGNKYGIIRPHSKIDREYSVVVDGVPWGAACYCYKLRGIKLAVKLIESGCTQKQLNRVDLDGRADHIHYGSKENRQTAIEMLIEEVKAD